MKLLFICILSMGYLLGTLKLPTVYADGDNSGGSASIGLSNPNIQPKFVNAVPDPLDTSFVYNVSTGSIDISVGQGIADTGLVGPDGESPVSTPIWGYGTPAWPPPAPAGRRPDDSGAPAGCGR